MAMQANTARTFPNKLFVAVADSTRRTILRKLAHKPCTVTELLEPSKMSQPAISQHLKILREADLVQVRVVGRYRYYELEPTRLKLIFDWVQYFEKFWDIRLANLAGFLNFRKKRKTTRENQK